MTELFVDTSGWAEAFISNQRKHIEARSYFNEALQRKCRIVTTNYVLTELTALLSSHVKVPRSQTIAILNGITKSPSVDVVHVDKSLHDRAWQLLSSHVDKYWSMVDSVSFVLMRDRGITDALTTDHHFEQAGFTAILK